MGFKTKVKKTSEFPVQSLIYLGVQLDLKALTLNLPLREDLKAQEHVQVNFNGTAGIQSGSGGIDRFSYLIVLGSALN